MFKLYFSTYVADVVASVTLNYQLIENSLEFESDISDSENEVDIVEETLNVGCVTNKEFLKLTTSTCN
jgi:hypothetical protein